MVWFLGGLGLFVLLVVVMVIRHKRGRVDLRQGETIELEIPHPGGASQVNRTKAVINKEGFQFQPFRVKDAGIPLADAGLREEEELILMEYAGEKMLFAIRQMGYHHLAQGKIAGEPYLVSF